MPTKTPTDVEIEKKIITALDNPYRTGIETKRLGEKIRVQMDNSTEERRFYKKMKSLKKQEKVKSFKKERNVINFLPKNEALARKTHGKEEPSYQKPRLDFKPDIEAWYEQLSHWDEFFTPWIHSRKLMFDGYLGVEYEPTYTHFKKFVENMLEKNPDLCLNPFDEQDKLKRKMKKFNELRDKILDEFKGIIENKIPDIKDRLPNFDENFKQSLLQIIFMRKTYEFLNQQKFEEKFCVEIKNNFPISKNNEYNTAVLEVLDLLSEEIDRSQVITRKSMVEVWTMISESQMICTSIIRALKVLGRIK